MTPPVDVRGYPLNIDDFVVYTINAEGSALAFGHIDQIIDKSRTDRSGTLWEIYHIVVAKTTPDGKPLLITQWDSEKREYYEISKQQKSGRITHHKSKFMKI